MQSDEIEAIAVALGRPVLATETLAGGFSHETCLLTLDDAQVVARLGGPDPAIEAAVMAAARPFVPVPEVLHVLPAVGDGARPAMVIEFVAGTPLSEVLARGGPAMGDLGAEVGRVAARIATATFDRPGFFTDAGLATHPQPPWSKQLAEFAESCMTATPEQRLDSEARRAWAALCAEHAPALAAIDDQARLAHADLNPKNILVTRAADGWRVDAVLDWEFSYASSPYGDAANMARFGADYPAGFLSGFGAAFAEHQPADLPLLADWAYLGRLLDMFALSDLVTRGLGHPVADQAATVIRQWLATGVPRFWGS
jgi:Ser/Thr protein kinase RdoA (MazF antagonist)